MILPLLALLGPARAASVLPFEATEYNCTAGELQVPVQTAFDNFFEWCALDVPCSNLYRLTVPNALVDPVDRIAAANRTVFDRVLLSSINITEFYSSPWVDICGGPVAASEAAIASYPWVLELRAAIALSPFETPCPGNTIFTLQPSGVAECLPFARRYTGTAVGFVQNCAPCECPRDLESTIEWVSWVVFALLAIFVLIEISKLLLRWKPWSSEK